jgi:hypothetical protein
MPKRKLLTPHGRTGFNIALDFHDQSSFLRVESLLAGKGSPMSPLTLVQYGAIRRDRTTSFRIASVNPPNRLLLFLRFLRELDIQVINRIFEFLNWD